MLKENSEKFKNHEAELADDVQEYKNTLPEKLEPCKTHVDALLSKPHKLALQVSKFECSSPAERPRQACYLLRCCFRIFELEVEACSVAYSGRLHSEIFEGARVPCRCCLDSVRLNSVDCTAKPLSVEYTNR